MRSDRELAPLHSDPGQKILDWMAIVAATAAVAAVVISHATHHGAALERWLVIVGVVMVVGVVGIRVVTTYRFRRYLRHVDDEADRTTPPTAHRR